MRQLSVLIKMLLFWAALMVISVIAYHLGADHSLSLSIPKMPPESFSRIVVLALFCSLLVTFFDGSLRKFFGK